ncbi:hypothetical protein AB1Y20_013009 [Prymnesium parvum]|uniref:Transmembrane protein n=1 Tax=Prymnesium parvum TaxID=97485 RepID=A0AB34IM80_PRYPA
MSNGTHGLLGSSCAVTDDCHSCNFSCDRGACACVWYWAMSGEACDEPTADATWWMLGRGTILLTFAWVGRHSLRVACAGGRCFGPASFAASPPLLTFLGCLLILFENGFTFFVALGTVHLSHTARNVQYIVCYGVGLGLVSVSFFVVSLRWLEHARVLEKYLRVISTAKQLIVSWLLFFSVALCLVIALAASFGDAATVVLNVMVCLNSVLVMGSFSVGSHRLAKVLADATAQQLCGLERTSSSQRCVSRELRRAARSISPKMSLRTLSSNFSRTSSKFSLASFRMRRFSSELHSSPLDEAATSACDARCTLPASPSPDGAPRVLALAELLPENEPADQPADAAAALHMQHRLLLLLRRVAWAGRSISFWVGGVLSAAIVWQASFYADSCPLYWLAATSLHLCGARASSTLLHYLDVSMRSSERRKEQEAGFQHGLNKMERGSTANSDAQARESTASALLSIRSRSRTADESMLARPEPRGRRPSRVRDVAARVQWRGPRWRHLARARLQFRRRKEPIVAQAIEVAHGASTSTVQPCSHCS